MHFSGTYLSSSPVWTFLAAGLLAVMPTVHADSFDLIHDDLSITAIELRSVQDERIVYSDPMMGRGFDRRLDEVLALVRRNVSMEEPRHAGWLVLADGQRFPGQPANVETEEQTFAWEHHSLGTINVPLDAISTVQFDPDMAVPEGRTSDVVLLTNGDWLEGFIIDLRDPVVIEIEQDGEFDLVNIDRRHVAAVNLVTPATEPAHQRLWLRDGTVMEVSEVDWPYEDRANVAFVTRWAEGTREVTIRARRIAALSVDAARLLPLASMTPRRIEGPGYRYEIPAPLAIDEKALLELHSLELRGPLMVRYALPDGAKRFAAELSVPPAARPWIDAEIIIRADEFEIFRQALDAHEPAANFNIPLHGRELSIEITDGRYGSIQNQVQLIRPRLFID